MRHIMILLAIFCAVIASAKASTALVGSFPEDYGLPRRGSLGDTYTLEQRKDLSNLQKMRITAVWLERERANPTPPFPGHGGCEINTQYIQAQLIKTIAEFGDPRELRIMAANEKNDPTMRDAYRLALGIMGDRQQSGELVRILKTSPDPYYRVLAATYLRFQTGPEVKSALEAATKDNYEVSCDNGTRKVYPIKREAAASLAIVEAPGFAESLQQRWAKFDNRLRDQEAEAQTPTAK